MKENNKHYEERILKAPNGLGVLLLDLVLILASIFGFIVGATMNSGFGTILIIISVIYLCLPSWILFMGIKILKPNEALVLTLFGKYTGTLKGEGIFFVNPFSSAVNPGSANNGESVAISLDSEAGVKAKSSNMNFSKKISLKTMTLNNDKQKINDLLGNPIIIGIAVIWKIDNTAKAVFNVDNYKEFLSIQCDAALRNTVRLYPYDVSDGGDEKSLRGSSVEIAEMLQEDIQKRVDVAGLVIESARITTLSYSQEIAAVMLQRQQASAVIDARKMIVEGAVSMVQMAIEQLAEGDVCNLDEERKAQMVSNLMVVLCGNKDAQPIVNSGSIY
ncbi:MAG: SPFH domain-containing protein [Suipraeoptans sp.]